MNFLIYIIIFLAGAFFGSFFTLAVYRIPKNEDILIKHSYCPNCNHKLGFFDLFPIFSYILLKGKCRYCGNKIRARYLILEILSGFTFVLVSISLRYNFINIMTNEIIYLIFSLLYISILFIIAGIDKEKIKIEKPVILFGFICVMLYIVYLYIVGIDTNIYRYVIYLIAFVLFTLFNTIYLKRKAIDSYPIDVLLLLTLMAMFTYEVVSIYTVIITLIAISIHELLKNISINRNKSVKLEEKSDTKIPIAFYMCIANIATLIITNLYIFN